MYFKDVIGQKEAKRQLIKEAKEGKIAHARLFYGKEGVGKLPLAIAFARYLSCSQPNGEDACGKCPNCIKYGKLAHPDLHFIFPVVKKKNKDTTSDDYLQEWRKLVNETPYFNLGTWLQHMDSENSQAHIFVKESDEIIRKLSLKSSGNGYKIVIIWLPEKMNIECSNKLLKLLEEPTERTLFMLVSEEPDSLLPTILSRTQKFRIPGIADEDIAKILSYNYSIQEDEARAIAYRSEGNFLRALEVIKLNEDKELFFSLFVNLMRLSYQRKIREMKTWSETLAALGRERQKLFLAYGQEMIRENFMHNFHANDLLHLDRKELDFASRFAPFVNEGNIMLLMHEIDEAEKHIEQNVSAKMVFFDLALKTIVALVRK